VATPNNTVVIPEEISEKIKDQYPECDHDSWENHNKAIGAEYGYSLAIDQLADKDKEIADLWEKIKGLSKVSTDLCDKKDAELITLRQQVEDLKKVISDQAKFFDNLYL